MPDLATTLDAVTVFPDRARVTRRGRLSLEPGQHKLDLTDLPLALLPDSVRATGHGTARARLLGIRTEMRHYVETPAEAARELEARIQALQDDDAGLAVQAEGLGKAVKALDELAAESGVFARGLAFRNRTPEDQGALYDFIAQREQTLQAEILALARRRRDLAKEIDRLQRELAGLQSARPRQRWAATVEVEALTAGELEIELTYLVQAARWTPLYDLRFNGEELEITYLAEVAQGTGEDWPGVSLTLSTARPALALVIPELDPWYVGPRPASPPHGKMMATRAMAPQAMAARAPTSAGFALGMDEDEGAAEPVFLEIPSAEVSESGAALTYQISGRADVPGNHDARKVTIGSFRLRPALDLVTAPRLEPVCYRRLQGKNESPYTLLPGTAQLFEGDEYLGATQLEHTAPGQELELALGADERVRIERKLTSRSVDKTFSLAGRRRIRWGYRIEVENLRDVPQTVLVRDQLPVARHEQIKVKLEAADPKPTRHTELNQLEWKLTLGKGARQVLVFDFSVELPREMEVGGLAG